MTEDAFKVYLGRLEESAVYSYIHKNDVWKKQLESNRNALMKNYLEQKETIGNMEKALAFYADGPKYYEMNDPSGVLTVIEEDSGEIAREALGLKEKQRIGE